MEEHFAYVEYVQQRRGQSNKSFQKNRMILQEPYYRVQRCYKQVPQNPSTPLWCNSCIHKNNKKLQ
jgi:hypothetical protein